MSASMPKSQVGYHEIVADLAATRSADVGGLMPSKGGNIDMLTDLALTLLTRALT
jgi:hypothetical protein